MQEAVPCSGHPAVRLCSWSTLCHVSGCSYEQNIMQPYEVQFEAQARQED